MSFTEAFRNSQRVFLRYVYYVIAFAFRVLPLGAMKPISKIIRYVGPVIAFSKGKDVDEGLRTAFGDDMQLEQIKEIKKRYFDTASRTMTEFMYFCEHTPLVEKYFSFEGQEHIDAALQKGKGVLAVTAHMGAFPLMLVRLAQAGYKTNIILRPTRDSGFLEFLIEKTKKEGVDKLNYIVSRPPREAVQKMMSALRNNEIVVVLLDQNFGAKGRVFVDFFGEQAATGPGPIVMAARTGAEIIPMFTMHDEGNNHRIIVESPYNLEYGQDDDETKRINTQGLTKIIEDYVRKFPHEWFWVHRRWKSRPSPTELEKGGE